jgi:hypothetical protein
MTTCKGIGVERPGWITVRKENVLICLHIYLCPSNFHLVFIDSCRLVL